MRPSLRGHCYFPANSRFTISLTIFPSTRMPAALNLAMAFFMTVPISFMVGDAHFRDGGFYSRDDFRFSGGFGEVGFDHDDFGGFFVGHFLASAFGELLDGFFALFDQRGQHGLGFLIVERGHLFDLALAATRS